MSKDVLTSEGESLDGQECEKGVLDLSNGREGCPERSESRAYERWVTSVRRAALVGTGTVPTRTFHSITRI